MSEYKEIKPTVNKEAEFLEIASDFGDPLEVIREAISNAYDASASQLKIDISIDNKMGYENLIIVFEDNGDGMDELRLTENFWNLGDSYSRNINSAIGEKGHGTKIYLRSDMIDVFTTDGSKAYHSKCELPFRSLRKGQLHKPVICEIDITKHTKGTRIILEGYAKEFSRYKQDIIKDYIFWFTKQGAIENEFRKFDTQGMTIDLKALDVDEFESIPFGHEFAQENSNIHDLYEAYDEKAAEYFVKKYSREDISLDKFPHVKYDVVIYVEGDEAKRQYNPLLSSRINKKNGKYKVSDRYGIWLCKDFIPIQRVNEWITSFGQGSNSYVMLHGFVNCQEFRLTANRGTIANTNIEIIEALKLEIQEMLKEIDEDLYKKELYTLKQWQFEAKTLRIEEIEFERRKKNIRQKKVLSIGSLNILEPKNESELFSVFNSIYALHPDRFEFEPLDYNTNIGIDIIARNKSTQRIADCEFWYVELKHMLSAKGFNHSFKNLRWILCWDFTKDIKDGTEITSDVDNETRRIKIGNDKGKKVYFLENDSSSIRIKVVRLKEFLETEMNLIFEKQK